MPIYRVELTAQAYEILEAEAFIRRSNLKSVASDMIARSASQRAIELASHRDEKPEKQKVEESECGASADGDKKRKLKA